MTQSICIIRLSALGDVLMLVPLVRSIQEQLPTAKITWIISRPAYDLVKDMEGVGFVVIEKPKGFRDYLRFKQRMKHQIFDVLLATQASLRANLLIPCIRAKKKIGYDKHRARDGQRWFIHESISFDREHTLEGFLKFIQPLGLSTREIKWDLPLSSDDVSWVAQHHFSTSSRLVLINPAASKPERSWQVEKYIELIRYLKKHWQVQIVLTGGPTLEDQKLSEQITQVVSVDLNLVGKTKPKQLLALIKHADLMICPDTGPAHMAAAVSTPVIAMHAVTNPDISGPYTFRNFVVNLYPLALETFLKLTVEKAPWGTQVHDTLAMKLVSVEAVAEKVDQLLGEKEKKLNLTQ